METRCREFKPLGSIILGCAGGERGLFRLGPPHRVKQRPPRVGGVSRSALPRPQPPHPAPTPASLCIIKICII